MALIDVIYKSLLLFTGLFTAVLIISYTAYKIKNKGKNNLPYETEPEFPKSPGEIFNKDKQFLTTSVYSTSNYPKRAAAVKRKKVLPRKQQRYKKVETLYNEHSNNATINERHTPKRHFAGDYNVSSQSEFKKHSHGYKLAYGNVLNYYADRTEEEFYLFKTKY